MKLGFSKLELTRNYQKDIFYTLLFGFLSLVFSYLNFSIPGVEGAGSDLRELPLIAGIIHISNPVYSIVLSALTILSQTEGGSHLSTFLMHTGALFAIWYAFSLLKRRKLNGFMMAVLSFLNVLVYYIILIIPLFVLTNYLVGLNLDKQFLPFYLDMIVLLKYEIFSTAIAVSIYYVQYVLRRQLKEHKSNLEQTVKQRTEHLSKTIEELKSTQHQLVQSEKMASIGTLVSGVAHEINNPLNFISGGMGLINEMKPEIEKRLSKQTAKDCNIATHMISEGFRRTNDIVKALMTFARKGESTLEEKDVNSIIESTLLFMGSIFPDDINVKKEFHSDMTLPVYADKIHQVLYNILNNAVFELTNNQGATKEIVIKTSRNKDKAIITISNTGPQIPEKHLPQIFDPFFTTRDPDQGNGLGLSICYTFVHEHKGTIRAENIENGVKFTITLPTDLKP